MMKTISYKEFILHKTASFHQFRLTILLRNYNNDYLAASLED